MPKAILIQLTCGVLQDSLCFERLIVEHMDLSTDIKEDLVDKMPEVLANEVPLGQLAELLSNPDVDLNASVQPIGTRIAMEARLIPLEDGVQAAVRYAGAIPHVWKVNTTVDKAVANILALVTGLVKE